MPDIALSWLQQNIMAIIAGAGVVATAAGVAIGHMINRPKADAEAHLSDAQAKKTLSEIKPPEAYALKNLTDMLEAMTKSMVDRERAALQRDVAASEREERHLTEIVGLRREIVRLEDTFSELKADFVSVCGALLSIEDRCGTCEKRMPIPDVLIRRARELVLTCAALNVAEA